MVAVPAGLEQMTFLCSCGELLWQGHQRDAEWRTNNRLGEERRRGNCTVAPLKTGNLWLTVNFLRAKKSHCINHFKCFFSFYSVVTLSNPYVIQWAGFWNQLLRFWLCVFLFLVFSKLFLNKFVTHAVCVNLYPTTFCMFWPIKNKSLLQNIYRDSPQ